MNHAGYRAPPPARPLPRAPQQGLKWLWLAFVVGAILGVVGFVGAAVVTVFMRDHHGTIPRFPVFVLVPWLITALCTLGAGVTAAMWTRRVWAWLPEVTRTSPVWKNPISPNLACGLLFIPIFQFVWAFVLGQGLDEALNAMAQAYGCDVPSKRARTLGLVAVGTGWLGAFPISMVTFFMYMQTIDKSVATIQAASEDYARRGLSENALPPWLRVRVEEEPPMMRVADMPTGSILPVDEPEAMNASVDVDAKAASLRRQG